MNKDLDELLCLLDGKITAYRMKHPYREMKVNSKQSNLNNKDNKAYMKLIYTQKIIQNIWKENTEV